MIYTSLQYQQVHSFTIVYFTLIEINKTEIHYRRTVYLFCTVRIC